MSLWAWLGDMELDDALLGLGAAGIFSASEPIAVGFLVNAAHCAEQSGEGGLRASDMYREKRSLLDAFFGGRFHAILDRYAAGGKGRGWAGALTGQQLAGLGDACGLEDELGGWLEAVERRRPRVLHLLLSGPLLGRGEELCSALAARVLAPAAGAGLEDAPRLFLWAYAGSFNLAHSSEEDRASIRRLVEDHSPRVSVVEATLKAGAWICDPPQQFWATSCPVAWSQAEAEKNPIGFDVSTDIQSVNMFLQEYSSPGTNGAPKRGLQSIFQQIVDGGTLPGPQSQQADSISSLIRELEVRSLATNLTKMVPPDSASMAKLREALPVQQDQLESAYRNAVACLEELQADLQGGRPCTCEKLTLAAQAYAELYRGPSGTFLESGAVESFPPEKPFSGPRLDKRCILRCMSEGKLQGGPTADLLIVLALLLFLHYLDAAADAPEDEGTDAVVDTCCSLVCTASSNTEPKKNRLCCRLPSSTRELFHLQPAGGSTRVFSAMLRPDVEMNGTTRTALAPLIDLSIEALILGGIRLQKVHCNAGWGPLHGPLEVATKGG